MSLDLVNSRYDIKMSLDLVNLVNKQEGKVIVDKKFFLQFFVVKNLNPPPNKRRNISEIFWNVVLGPLLHNTSSLPHLTQHTWAGNTLV